MKYPARYFFFFMILISLSMVIFTLTNIYIENQDLQEELKINAEINSADDHLLLAVNHLNKASEYMASSQLSLYRASYDEAFKTCKLGITNYSEAKENYLIAVTKYKSALQKLQSLSDKKYDTLHKIFPSLWSSNQQDGAKEIHDRILELEFEISVVVPRIEQHIQLIVGCDHTLNPPRFLYSIV